MNSNSETDKQILETLQELVKWTKVSSYQNVKTTLEFVLNSDAKKIIYQSSDGSKSVQEIVKTKIASAGTISNHWNEWSKVGIGELLPVTGGKRFKHLFDLEDFGIVITKVKLKNEIKKDKNSNE